MKVEENFVIRSSGIVLVIMTIMIGMGILMLYISLQELKRGSIFGFILGLCLGLWFLVYSCVFIFGQKISIENNRLISSYSYDDRKSVLLPKFYKGDVDLAEISSVTIASINYFEKNFDQFKNQRLLDLMNACRGLRIPLGHGIPVSTPLGFALGKIVLIFIACKDGSGIEITTKPFSKKGIKKFIEELYKRDIPLHLDLPSD